MRCLRTILLSVAPLFAVALLVCCENETTSNLQAQRMELVNMITDSAGNCSLMALDNGDTLMLSKPLGDFRRDTVARYMVVYTTRKSVPYTTAVISSMGAPVTAWIMRYSSIPADTVYTESVWLGGGCLNLRLKVDDFGGAHYYGFAWLGWSVNADSSRTANVALYHNAREYKGYYNRTSIVCCPLSQVSSMLRSGTDSIALLTNERGKGMTWHVIPY